MNLESSTVEFHKNIPFKLDNILQYLTKLKNKFNFYYYILFLRFVNSSIILHFQNSSKDIKNIFSKLSGKYTYID